MAHGRTSWPLHLPEATFLDLPLEIRNEIYRYSLIASKSITVWSGNKLHDREDVQRDQFFRKISLISCTAVETEVTALHNLSLGLLRCNRIVAHEAVVIFYRWNTFHFASDDNWNPLYVFLQMIGEDNSGQLRNLHIEMLQPRRIWQHIDGTCTTLGNWLFRKVLPYHQHPHKVSGKLVEGKVDDVDPAIEACFRILGKDGPALTLALILAPEYVPGVQLWTDQQDSDLGRWSMEIPDLVERFRQEYTAERGTKSRIEMLWKGNCARAQFTEKKEAIQNIGWEILDAKEAEDSHYNFEHPRLMMQFTLRRKPLTAA